MKKNNQSRAVGKGRVLFVLFFLTISLSACSGLNLNFFGDKKAEAETESKDKESNAENKVEKADTEKESEKLRKKTKNKIPQKSKSGTIKIKPRNRKITSIKSHYQKRKMYC